jgi:hypothetical protein
LERAEYPLVQDISVVAKIILEKLHFSPPSYHLIACFEVYPLWGDMLFVQWHCCKKGLLLTLLIILTLTFLLDSQFF